MCDSSSKGIAEIRNIAGDKYNQDKIKNALKNKQTGIDDIISEVQNPGMTTSHMGQKFFSDPSVCNTYFTDSLNYMEKRHSVASKVATNKLLNYFANGYAFGPFVFCPYEKSKDVNFRKNYTYQAFHLMSYILKAGYDVNDYKYGKNTYEEEDWKALSYDK